MRYLIGLNWVLLAASTTMATVLSVVLLMYWVYRDEPIIQASFDSLLTQTAMFTGLALLAAAATQSLRKRWPAYWGLQICLLLAITATVSFYLPE